MSIDELSLDDLDKLAAEKIMGWHLPYGTENDARNYCYKDSDETRESWQPTRNIAQAWRILEKFDDVIKLERIPEADGEWSCIIDREIYDGLLYSNKRFQKICATAPEAITRACLKAIE